jgi:hypothetical protein
MPDPTLTEIAAEIRKHAPGALPTSIYDGGKHLWTRCATNPESFALLPDDTASHVLGFAMVMDCRADRFAPCDEGWIVHRRIINIPSDSTHESQPFFDPDHGGDPLLSLYAAWRWARGSSENARNQACASLGCPHEKPLESHRNPTGTPNEGTGGV